jgi:hypothetical protein
MTGSQHNDPFYMEDGAVRTRTNRCVLARGAGGGGLWGGRVVVALTDGLHLWAVRTCTNRWGCVVLCYALGRWKQGVLGSR